MRMQNPRKSVVLTAALALFIAGLLLAAHVAEWPRTHQPPTILITPL
jgi:hypothetical protein